VIAEVNRIGKGRIVLAGLRTVDGYQDLRIDGGKRS
jgi:hypothetical protein